MDSHTYKALKTLVEATDSPDDSFGWTGKTVAKEVADTKVGGATVRQHVRNGVRAIIKAAQDTHKMVEQARARVEAPGYSGTPMDVRELERLLLAEVEDVWGDDPGAKQLMQMLVSGKYIY